MGSWIGIAFALTAVAASVVVAQAAPVSHRSTSPPPVSASATPSPTGQMGPGRPGTTTPTPGPSGQMGGGGMGNMTPTAAPTGHTPSRSPSPGPSAQMQRISVPLQTMPAGTVTLSAAPHSRSVVAQLNLFGLAPGTQHRIALTASRDGGRPLVTFPDVTVSASGDLVQTVTGTRAGRGSLPRALSFQVDLLPTGQRVQPIAVAHAPVSWNGGDRVTLAVSSTIARPGHASLVYDPGAHQLTVNLQESGLVPGSQHAAHIHSGSCQAQGAVLYPLPDLVANASGNASEQVTISVPSAPPAGGWYVNVHDGTMNDILQADGQPGPLFQPLVCGNVHP